MTTGGRVGTDPTTEAPDQAPPRTWITVAEPSTHDDGESPVSLRRVLLQLVAGILVVLAVVTIGGTLAARRLAEREAVNDAAQRADLLAETVVQPALTDRLLARDPAATKAFDKLVHDRVLGDDVAHVKLWTTGGTVLYSDEPALVGRHFALDPEQKEALADPRTVAEISNLERDENSLDSAPDGKLVEVYRPVWTPGGSTMLFEIYEPYDQVSSRTAQLWRGFAGVTLTSLLLFVLLLVPLIWHLTSRVRRDQRQREMSAAARRRGLERRAPDDRRQPARRAGAGPGRHLLHGLGGGSPGRVGRSARPRAGAARGLHVRTHQHPRAALAAGRHLPAEPRPGRPLGCAQRPRAVTERTRPRGARGP